MSSHTIYNPAKDYGLQDIDLLSLVFDSPMSLATDDSVLHIEAGNTANQVTKAQCREFTQRIAYILREQFGVGANGSGIDVIACISSGHLLMPGVYSAASPSFTAAELSNQLNHGKCTLIIASRDCRHVALQAAEQCGIPSSRVLILKSGEGKRSLRACSAEKINLFEEHSGQLQWERISDPTVLQNRICSLFYSSGTTGNPKAVKFSQRNLSSSAQVSLFAYQDYILRQENKSPAFKAEYRTIAHLPLAHIGGCQSYFLHPSLCAGTVYWMPKFHFTDFLNYCKVYRITTFFTVPPIYQLLINSPLVTNQFQHMRYALSGAALMSAELAKKVKMKLGCTFAPTWGMTETTGSVTVSLWDNSVTDGSLSPLLANMRLRIVNDQGLDVRDGEIGEFIVQGPMVTQGYWNDEQASRDAFTADGGWFKTGDLGYHMDGAFFITDRKKEIIKYKGFQVAPTELETLLLSHPQIKDAAVVGVPDPDMEGNELPCAYVVVDQGEITEGAIQKFVESNLASFKHLRGGVIFTKGIPKSPSGKVLRRELKEAAKTAIRVPTF